jgi:RNA polymerase sigma-70 factor, ECF subfamily
MEVEAMCRDPRDSAAERLFRPKVRRDVLHWLARLGVPARDRDDVASQVWLVAWTSWPTFDPARARPERWLNRIAVHVASHYHDRAHHRRERLTGDLTRRVHLQPDAAFLMEVMSDSTRLLEALGELDPGSRHVLISHDLDEIPMAELAQTTGIPISTLYRRRARALVALRAALERLEKGS